jgi:hypothetical protein
MHSMIRQALSVSPHTAESVVLNSSKDDAARDDNAFEDAAVSSSSRCSVQSTVGSDG